MANRVLDIYLTYSFLKRLTTPFEKWPAYELGIIDADGNVLKKRKDLETLEEKSAWGYFDIMIANLKKLIEKLPGGKTRIATFAAALLLLKEQKNITTSKMLEEKFDEYMVKAEDYLSEEGEGGTPANAVSTGKVAGLGVGPQGEPGVNKMKMKKLLKRKVPDVDPKLYS